MLALSSTSSQPLGGIFALQAGRAQTQAHMIATQIGTSPLRRHLDLWQTRAGSQTVSRYDVVMTKYLHLIVISDDFTTFLHVHPALENDHHFRIDVQFPKEGLYHVYADDEPDGIGQQVFRYELRVGSHVEHGRTLRSTGSQVTAGPYRVRLGATRLRTGSENELAVHITSNGHPASDLHPYLGAHAHAVFIDAGDLSYAHVHPMPLESEVHGMSAMTGMSGTNADDQSKPVSNSKTTSPDMTLHVRIREAGTYKLWLQFRGRDGLYVAPFVVTASPALALAGVARAKTRAIVVSDAWSRPANDTAVVYAVLRNPAACDDRLLGASSPFASRITLHETSDAKMPPMSMSMSMSMSASMDNLPMTGSMTSMKSLASIPIPARGTTLLKPGGYHLMLDLRRPTKAGEVIPLRLHFERAGWIAANASVSRPSR